jgi:hypothetical protein
VAASLTNYMEIGVIWYLGMQYQPWSSYHPTLFALFAVN